MKLHFVIVTYNGEKWIERCLDSIRELKGDITVHLIDNASTDSTVELCQSQGFEVIEKGSNLGFGAANNLGMQKAMSEGATHIFLLNQDAYMDVNSIENFQSTVHAEDKECLYAFLQMSGDGTEFDPFWEQSYLQNKNCPDFMEDYRQAKLKKKYPMRFANAAAWLLPATLIQKIGGFSPAFFHYGEDINYINRLHFHNFQVILLPESIVYHDRDVNKRKESPHQTAQKKALRNLSLSISHPSISDGPLRAKTRLLRKVLGKIKRLEKLHGSQELLQLQSARDCDFDKLIQYREQSRKMNGPFI